MEPEEGEIYVINGELGNGEDWQFGDTSEPLEPASSYDLWSEVTDPVASERNDQ